MAAVASALLRLTMVRVRLAHSSSRVGSLESEAGIGAARMSRSSASMSGASLCKAVMDVRSRACRMAWLLSEI